MREDLDRVDKVKKKEIKKIYKRMNLKEGKLKLGKNGNNWYSLSDYDKAEVAYWAIRFNKVEVLSIMLQDTVFLNRRRIFPLHVAVEWTNINSIKYLLENAYFIDSLNSSDGTALHLAIKRTRYRLATFLVKAGANIAVINKNYENAISLAVKFGDESFIKFILRKVKSNHESNHALLNARYGNYGATLFGLAENNYRIKTGAIYKKLLHLGVDLNKPVERVVRFTESNLILIRVAWAGMNSIASHFIRDVLTLASRGQLASPFRPNASDQNGNTILHALAIRSNVKGTRLILKQREIDIEARNLEGKTPLNCAIEGGKIQIVNLLVNHGCSLNSRGTLGQLLPFDQAVQEQFIKAACVMVMEGVRIEDCDSKTAIMEGEIQGFDKINFVGKVHTLFNLSRIATRRALVAANGIVNERVATRINLPKPLLKEVISPFPTI